MHLVLLTHPPTLGSTSMPRFAAMIADGMQQRGHSCQLWTSTPKLSRVPFVSSFIRKWLGYWDQFISFPRVLRRAVAQQPDNTLFVLTDQALGMWLPQVAHRPHVVHCHDFLALRSALGEFPENPTGWTGRQYQRLIRNGFSGAQNFISVSKKTQMDLHRFLPRTPKRSTVVYNGLNHPFRPLSASEAAALLPTILPDERKRTPNGHLVHIGGNQWYKNRFGVLEIYQAYAANNPHPAELWMIGAEPSVTLKARAEQIPVPGQVRFLCGLTNEQVNVAYSTAQALLFPSLEEGFGWPIIEAMASGCPVLTTDLAPMTEIAGNAARLIPRMPSGTAERATWALAAAKIVAEVVQQSSAVRQQMIATGLEQAAKFSTSAALDAYERIYAEILAKVQL